MIRMAFNAMRQQNSLVDAEFIPLDEEPGVVLPAHRSFLVAASDYFHDLFCGGLGESQVPVDHLLPIPLPYSTACAKLALGEFPPTFLLQHC